jgi:hypothetical protein
MARKPGRKDNYNGNVDRHSFCNDMGLNCSACPLIICIEDLTNDSAETHFHWTNQICAAWPHETLKEYRRVEERARIIDHINGWMNSSVFEKAKEIAENSSKHTVEETSRAKIIVALLRAQRDSGKYTQLE